MKAIKFTIIAILITSGLVFSISGCKDKNDDEKDAGIDKTALLLGTWLMIETTDAANAPVKLLYTFEADGKFTQSVTVRKGRTKSITDATWRFADAEQTQLELSLSTAKTYTIELLDETNLRLNDGSIVSTFVKQ